MSDLISYVAEWSLGIIDRMGYPGIFILSALESMAIPIPSEIVIPFSGFLAAVGKFNLWLVIFVSTLANLCGSIILFLIGKSGGRWFLERYGKYFLIHKKDLDRSDRWFNEHGVKAVFWSRMLPVVRTFISLPAGISGVSLEKFVFYTFCGSLPWNTTLVFVGFKLGENWETALKYFDKFNLVIYILIVALIILYIVKHKKKKHG